MTFIKKKSRPPPTLLGLDLTSGFSAKATEMIISGWDTSFIHSLIFSKGFILALPVMDPESTAETLCTMQGYTLEVTPVYCIYLPLFIY